MGSVVRLGTMTTVALPKLRAVSSAHWREEPELSSPPRMRVGTPGGVLANTVGWALSRWVMAIQISIWYGGWRLLYIGAASASAWSCSRFTFEAVSMQGLRIVVLKSCEERMAVASYWAAME